MVGVGAAVDSAEGVKDLHENDKDPRQKLKK
jgi:hypothetical protein